MAKQIQDINSENKLKFLLAEHSFALEERWKNGQHVWEVFKFYITLLTGAVGFVVAIGTANSSNKNIYWTIVAISCLIFFLGVVVFLYMVRQQFSLIRIHGRLAKVRSEIANLTNLNEYIEYLNDAHINFGQDFFIDNNFSLSAQAKRAITSLGIKTQLNLINSFIGTILAISVLFLFNISISLEAFIGIGIVSYILFCLFHAILALVWASFQKKGKAQ